MCNDIPRNRLHRKMFGELIAEELHRTLSHINCTPASVAYFGELAGRRSESTCCATQVPKMHMANLENFLGCVGSRSTKTLENMSILGCACVKMEPFVLLFFPSFVVVFASKLGIFFKNVVFWECRKGYNGCRKGHGEFGQHPKTAEMPTKQGESQQDQNRPHHRDWNQNWTNIAPTLPENKNVGDVRLPKSHKCQTFDIFEVHEAQNAGFLGRKRFSKHECWKFSGFMKHKNAGNLMSVTCRKHKNAGNFRMSGLMKVARAQMPERGCLPPWSTKEET